MPSQLGTVPLSGRLRFRYHVKLHSLVSCVMWLNLTTEADPASETLGIFLISFKLIKEGNCPR
jgi:hypothetical protein